MSAPCRINPSNSRHEPIELASRTCHDHARPLASLVAGFLSSNFNLFRYRMQTTELYGTDPEWVLVTTGRAPIPEPKIVSQEHTSDWADTAVLACNISLAHRYFSNTGIPVDFRHVFRQPSQFLCLYVSTSDSLEFPRIPGHLWASRFQRSRNLYLMAECRRPGLCHPSLNQRWPCGPRRWFGT